jgi:hypothetical protein
MRLSHFFLFPLFFHFSKRTFGKRFEVFLNKTDASLHELKRLLVGDGGDSDRRKMDKNSSSSPFCVRFTINYATEPGQHVRLIGSASELGQWKPEVSFCFCFFAFLRLFVFHSFTLSMHPRILCQ